MVEEAGKEGMDSGGGGRAGETRGSAIYYRFCYPTFIYSFISSVCSLLVDKVNNSPLSEN